MKAEAVAKEMKALRDQSGKLVFPPGERLTESQITSQFRQMAVELKRAGLRSIQEADEDESNTLRAEPSPTGSHF